VKFRYKLKKKNLCVTDQNFMVPWTLQ